IGIGIGRNWLELDLELVGIGQETTNIGAKGAQALANALQINKVTTILVLLPLHYT
ncbi:unnamed protein product, partial [Adineta steineri]